MEAIEAWLYGLTTLEVIGLVGVFVLVLICYLVQRIHNFLVEIMDVLLRIETDVGPGLEPDWVDGPKR